MPWAAPVPDPVAEQQVGPDGPEVDSWAVLFVRALRNAGVTVPVQSTILYVQALGRISMADRDQVYWAGRASLIHRPEQLATYDAAFEAFWLRAAAAQLELPVEEEEIEIALDDPSEDGDGDGEQDGNDRDILEVRFSAVETLREKDFALCNEDELAEAHRLMASLRFATSLRSSRRRIRSKRTRGRPDLARTVRRSLKAGGEPIDRAFNRSGTRARRLVLLLDVSGSMEPYARALLRFAHAAVVGRAKVEVFTIGTRLTRLTRELSTHDPDEALAKAAGAVADWSGGTRLGEAMAEFVGIWGQRGMARGAIVVVLSDGWDRGDPAELGEAMARLARVSHRLVWVNPLKASPGYAPLAQGMAAALPYVDDFIEGHSLESLERLGEVIAA